MTDVRHLKVSLTKHNAHKVAWLLKRYPASGVFKRLNEVKAEPAQARKNLSTLSGDVLPAVWSKARALGPEAIDALMLVAIIFSHHQLIRAMTEAKERHGMSGRLERGQLIPVKAYTNFARIIDQLGFATKHEYEGVNFNLKGMVELPGLGPLVTELLDLKLRAARWDGSGDVPREAVRLRFQKVFGVPSEEFRAWLSKGVRPAGLGPALTPKDEEFFEEDTEGSAQRKFEFRPGHIERDIERDVDPLTRSGSPRAKATRLHNDIQNKLYAHLRKKLGAKAVGTENDTGSGTAVDVVTVHRGTTTFYEIKTGPSVRTSIRQALPQLLEYAYWPADRRADELVVVSHLPATAAAGRYIKHLRYTFNLPLSYRQFDLDANLLI
jgi:hypothetical protein